MDDFWSNVEVIAADEGSAVSSAPLLARQQAPSERERLMLTGPAAAAPQHDVPASAISTLSGIPCRNRSIVLVGAHLHGKSQLHAALVGLPRRASAFDAARCLTTHALTQSAVVSGGEGLAAGAAPVLLTATDTPGHPDFRADVDAAVPLADCALLVVDAVEGFVPDSQRVLAAAVAEGVPIVLIISKIDRLVVDLRIPAADAYKKLVSIVDSVNVALAAVALPPVSPAHGTVIFTSTRFRLAISLPAVARRYEAATRHAAAARLAAGGDGGSAQAATVATAPPVDHRALAARMWGPYTYSRAKGGFIPIVAPAVLMQMQRAQSGASAGASASPTSLPKVAVTSGTPSFVEFVLDPIYKVVVAALRAPATFAAVSAADDLAKDAAVMDARGTLITAVAAKLSTVFGDFSVALVSATLEAAECATRRQRSAVAAVSTAKAPAATSASFSRQPRLLELLQTHFAAPLDGRELVREDVGRAARRVHAASSTAVTGQSEGDDDDDDVLAFVTRSGRHAHGAAGSSTPPSYGVVGSSLMIGGGPSGASSATTATGAGSSTSDATTLRLPLLKVYSGGVRVGQHVALYLSGGQILELQVRMLVVPTQGGLVRVVEAAPGSTVAVDLRPIPEPGHQAVANAPAPAPFDLDTSAAALLLPRGQKPTQPDVPTPAVERPGSGVEPLAKVEVEAVAPKDTERLEAILSVLHRSHRGVQFERTDGGTLVVAACGELHLDTALRDVRAAVSVRVSPPFTALAETVGAAVGMMRRHVEGPVGTAGFAASIPEATAALLERGVLADAPATAFGATAALAETRAIAFQRLRAAPHAWDSVQCANFAHATAHGCAVFLGMRDDASAAVPEPLRRLTHGVAQGAGSGPLCGEPMRAVAFTVTTCNVDRRVVATRAAQAAAVAGRELTHKMLLASAPRLMEPVMAVDLWALPFAVAFTVTTCNVDRRVVATRAAQAAAVAGRELTHKMLLASAPRLMEPVMAVDLWALPFAVEEARELLLKRRAWAIQEAHAPGTPLRLVSALMPLADAFGFETQLRVATRGAAYASLRPDHWALVPGDPLDASANLPPGEVAVGVAIAHDFMAKTRRRKGLADEVDRK